MNAIILAGGYAERLWPLTREFPKVLLRIAGASVLAHLLGSLSRVRDVKAVTIAIDSGKESYFDSADYSTAWTHAAANLDVSVHPLRNDGRIMGPLEKVAGLLDRCDDDVFLIGGDNIFGFDLNDFYGFYKKERKTCIAVQKLRQPEDVSPYGVPTFDQSTRRIIDFVEKPTEHRYELIATACYLFRRDDLEQVRAYLAHRKAETLGEFTQWLAGKSELVGFTFEDKWYDIGTPRGLLGANTLLLSNHHVRPPTIVRGRTNIENPVYVERGAIIAASHIGPYVHIGAGTRIEGSRVTNSIIYENCDIKPESEIQNSIIGPNSIIEGRVGGQMLGPDTKYSAW